MADIVRGIADGAGRFLAVEQRGRLLEREAPRLDDEDVQEGKLEGEPAAVEDVVLPLEAAERDRVDVLVEDDRDRDGEVEDVEALGTQAVGQDLDGVGDDEGRESKTGGVMSDIAA